MDADWYFRPFSTDLRLPSNPTDTPSAKPGRPNSGDCFDRSQRQKIARKISKQYNIFAQLLLQQVMEVRHEDL
jgi:hypothetical protein